MTLCHKSLEGDHHEVSDIYEVCVVFYFLREYIDHMWSISTSFD